MGYVHSVASFVSDSFVTTWTIAHQAPLSMGFPRQEYWSMLPFPVPEDLPVPGSEPASLGSPALVGRFLITALPGKPELKIYGIQVKPCPPTVHELFHLPLNCCINDSGKHLMT